jgi:DNA-binding NtrC family response regulator
MKYEKKAKVFIVDDDELYLKVLELELQADDEYIIEAFHTGEECIQCLDHKPDLIILDYWLNSIETNAINGIETLDRIKAFNPAIPVVMLSGQDKIEVAIDCMHHNATDYVVKSETAFLRLKRIITNTLQYQKVEKELNWYMNKM